MHKSYLAPGQVAELLMVSPATVRLWASKGLLQSIATPGGHRRFMKHEVERFARDNNLAYQIESSGTLRILVVDDDMLVSTYIRRYLDRHAGDIETMVANDGYTAGRLVQTFCPHIVLLDLMMPGLNGFDVCEQIKKDPVSKTIRVIAMTGFYDNENLTKSIAAGAECCIEKPLDLKQLDALIGKSLPVQAQNAARAAGAVD